jgi:hypothetical protein
MIHSALTLLSPEGPRDSPSLFTSSSYVVHTVPLKLEPLIDVVFELTLYVILA